MGWGCQGIGDAEGARVPEQTGVPYLLGVPGAPRLQGRAAPARALGTGWLSLKEMGVMAGGHLRSCPQERPRAAGVGVGPYLGGRRFRGAQKSEGTGAPAGAGGQVVGAAVVAAPWSVLAVGC